jgi:arsenate reductase
VLFVCIGNTCRSPMAEGFANSHGNDVLVARSVGLAPVLRVVPETVAPYDPFEVDNYDVVVNMAGFKLPGKAPRELLEWNVKDPYGKAPAVYRKVRDDIEARVMGLILKFRQ